MPEKTRLLVLSCSARKRPGRLLPAWERYDGPQYRVARKWLPDERTELRILSARYGLLAPAALIEDYDAKLTPQQALGIAPALRHRLAALCARLPNLQEVFLALGPTYLMAVTPLDWVPEGVRVYQTAGRIGERLSQLRRWLATGVSPVLEVPR